MHGELYQYLVLHQRLDLPGIGAFCIEKKPAYFDFADKAVYPPVFTIALQAENKTPSKNFFHWLGSRLDISERDAVIRFNDFLFGLKKELSDGHALHWPGIGTISKGLGGDTRFETAVKEYSPAAAVPAVQVLRQNAEHTLLVGEQETTSAAIKEQANVLPDRKRKGWWLAALVAGAVAAGFIVYYFSVNGFTASTVSNQKKLVPQSTIHTR